MRPIEHIYLNFYRNVYGQQGWRCIYCSVAREDATSIICPKLQPWWDKVLDWALRRKR